MIRSFFITDVCIPHSWMTVEAGSSSNIYFMITENGGLAFTCYIATMSTGVCDGPGFRAALTNSSYASYDGVTVS